MSAAGAVTESQGALIVDVTRPDDKAEIPPLMLVKSDGAYTYGTTDVATIDERVEDGCGRGDLRRRPAPGAPLRAGVPGGTQGRRSPRRTWCSITSDSAR
jgi:hypothetical protein